MKSFPDSFPHDIDLESLIIDHSPRGTLINEIAPDISGTAIVLNYRISYIPNMHRFFQETEKNSRIYKRAVLTAQILQATTLGSAHMR
jgi:hypothetical protein